MFIRDCLNCNQELKQWQFLFAMFSRHPIIKCAKCGTKYEFTYGSRFLFYSIVIVSVAVITVAGTHLQMNNFPRSIQVLFVLLCLLPILMVSSWLLRLKKVQY